jgi:hypothetical protein
VKTRRGFLGALLGGAAALTLDPERLLWKPGAKLISIPNKRLVSGQITEIVQRFQVTQRFQATPVEGGWTGLAFNGAAIVPNPYMPRDVVKIKNLSMAHDARYNRTFALRDLA